MTGGTLRKTSDAKVTAALSERGFRRQRAKERFRRTDGVEAPLQAQLLVSVDTDRYGLVRITGGVEVVAEPVEDAYDTVPDGALTEFQEIYRDRRRYPLASATFQRLSDSPQDVPFEWTASDDEGGDRAVGALLGFVDGPVRHWLDGRTTVEGLRASVAEGGAAAGDAHAVRNVSVLDVLLGRPDLARERLERYAAHPRTKIDDAERVARFRAWLETVQPRPDLVDRAGRPQDG